MNNTSNLPGAGNYINSNQAQSAMQSLGFVPQTSIQPAPEISIGQPIVPSISVSSFPNQLPLAQEFSTSNVTGLQNVERPLSSVINTTHDNSTFKPYLNQLSPIQCNINHRATLLQQQQLPTPLSYTPVIAPSPAQSAPLSSFTPQPPLDENQKPIKELLNHDTTVAYTSMGEEFSPILRPYGLHIHHSKGTRLLSDRHKNQTEKSDGLLSEAQASILDMRNSVSEKLMSRKVDQANKKSSFSSYYSFDTEYLILEKLCFELGELNSNLEKIREAMIYVYRCRPTVTLNQNDETKIDSQLKSSSVDEPSSIEQSYGVFWHPYSSRIQDFHFEFRGLMLTIKFYIEEQIRKMNAWWSISNITHKREQLENRVRKLQDLVVLTHIAVLIATEKRHVIEQCLLNNNPITQATKFYPFCDSIVVPKYESLIRQINPSDFFVEIGDQFAPKLRRFLNLYVAVTASHSSIYRVQNPNIRTGLFIVSNMYYLMKPKEAAEKASKFLDKDLSVESGKGLWTMLDTNKFVRKAAFLGLVDIDLSATFQIPFQQGMADAREAIEIQRAEQQEADKMEHKAEMLGGIKIQEVTGSSTMKELLFYYHQSLRIMRTVTNIPDVVQLRIIAAHDTISNCVTPRSPTDPNDGNFDNNNGIRGSLKRDYPHLGRLKRAMRKTTRLPLTLVGKKHHPTNGVIFHVHGGGFIAMSSFSHETYLRPWSLQTSLPVVSVDYTNSPDQQYPVQIEQCYQSYLWLLLNAEEELGIKLDKIIFAGDSAGGNLILAVLTRAILDGVRLPDSLVLSYPATYLNFSPSPARIISMLDPLLNFKLLELCGMEYYLNRNNMHVTNNAQRNPLISPSMLPDEILRKFPMTYINCGALDPLFDDGIYLAKRLESAIGPKKIKLEVYDALGHGYLNLIDFVPEAKTANNRICDWIKTQIKE